MYIITQNKTLQEVFVNFDKYKYYCIITDNKYNTKNCNKIEKFDNGVITYSINIEVGDYYFVSEMIRHNIYIKRYLIEKIFEKYCIVKLIEEIDMDSVYTDVDNLIHFTYNFIFAYICGASKYKTHCNINNINIIERRYNYV